MKKLTLKNPLKKGSNGEEVETLQTMLGAIKARPILVVDGKFGPNTKKAVCHFQKLRFGYASGISTRRWRCTERAYQAAHARFFPHLVAGLGRDTSAAPRDLALLRQK